MAPASKANAGSTPGIWYGDVMRRSNSGPGTPETTGFTWTDALVLLVVCLGSEPVGLSIRGVIAAGDYLNHAILTYAELNGALARLTALELVAVDRKHYRPTALATRLLVNARSRRLSLAAVTDLHSALTLWSQGVEAHALKGHRLSRAAYTRAVTEYLGGTARD